LSAPVSAAILLDHVSDNPLGSLFESQTNCVSLMPSSAGTLCSIVDNSALAGTDPVGSCSADNRFDKQELFGDGVGYLRMVMSDPFSGEAWTDPGDKVVFRSTCGGCHGATGASSDGDMSLYPAERINSCANGGVAGGRGLVQPGCRQTRAGQNLERAWPTTLR